MRSFHVLLLLLLAMPVVTAAPRQDAVLEFTAPSQLAGSIQMEGLQWAILVFDEGSGMEVNAELDGVWRAANHTSVNPSHDGISIIGRSSSRVPLDAQDLPHEARFAAEMAWRNVGSLLVIADSVSISMDARSELRPPKPNSTFEDYLAMQIGFANAIRSNAHPVGPSDVVSTPNEISDRPVQLHAQGVRLLEWYDAQLRCTGECLPGGGPSRLLAANLVHLDLQTHIAVQSSGGILDGSGKVVAAAFGGPSLSARTDGYGRFANANLTGQCGPRACPNPDGQAFRANGTLQLHDVHLTADGGGRMQAKFTGEIRAASFDEAPVFHWSTRTVTIGAFTLFALAALAKATLALFTRHQRPALEQPRTKLVYDLICAKPGRSFSDLRDEMRSGNGNLERHLDRLLKERLIAVHEFRNSLRYYDNHGRYVADWKAHAALQDERRRQVHEWLLARPASTQAQIQDAVASDWPRSTLRHAVKVLEEAGLLREERRGRFVHYWAIPVQEPGP